jgi:uncharacterized protein (TIGR02145 family)
VKDYDGNFYKTIKIGNQVWMAENLKTTHYADGTALINGNDELVITSTNSTKFMFDYDKNSANTAVYGKLYSGAALMNGAASSSSNPSGVQGVCPTDWHVPSDAEWIELISFLGGVSVAGGKMKETGNTHWKPTNSTATNESGFNALPGGWRAGLSPYFRRITKNGHFWSATTSTPDGIIHYYTLNESDGSITPSSTTAFAGFSVRCVQNN